MNKINEELFPSSMLFIPQKNQPILVDTIEKGETKNQLPRIYFQKIKKIIHYFTCEGGDYKRTEIYYNNNNYPQKVNLFDEQRIKLDYSSYCFKFFSFLKNDIISMQKKGEIEYSSNVPYLLTYGKLNYFVYYVCGREFIPTPKRHIPKTPIKKKELTNPLFKQTKLFDLLGYDLSINERKMNRHNTFSLLTKLMENNSVVFNSLDFPTTQQIIHPVYYINNIDQISLNNNDYHCNTFCLFLSINKFKLQTEEILNHYYYYGENRTETFEKFYNLLINYSIALFYILLSNNITKEKDFNCYNIFFLSLFLMNRWYFNNSLFTSDLDIDTLYRKITKKFDKIQTTGIYNYLNGIIGIVSAGATTQCKFPTNFTKEEKNEWKSNHNITRKDRVENNKRKTKIDKNMIRRIKRNLKSGMTKSDICKKENITMPTLNKIIKRD